MLIIIDFVSFKTVQWTNTDDRFVVGAIVLSDRAAVSKLGCDLVLGILGC
jgi:hypothetical protein